MNSPLPTSRSIQCRPDARRRGTAMMEMIFSLLLITLILSLLFFFGRGVVRVQRSQVVDRYEAWREVAHSWGPSSNNHLGGPQLNDTFFGGNASSVSQSTTSFFPRDARDDLIDEAQAFSNETSEVVELSHDDFVKGRSVRMVTRHDESHPLWNQFDKSAAHRHTRIEHEWKAENRWVGAGSGQHLRGSTELYHYWGVWHSPNNERPYTLPAARDTFMLELDEPLRGLANNGNHLAGRMRQIYSHRPAYRGPTLR